MKKVKIESKTCVSKNNLFWTNMDPELVNSIEQLQNDLDNANSKVSELSNRILEALDYINEKAPKVSTLILDTKDKVKLLAILKGANEKELYKEILKGSDK